MLFLKIFIAVATSATNVVAGCNRDRCFRALKRHDESASADCQSFLGISTVTQADVTTTTTIDVTATVTITPREAEDLSVVVNLKDIGEIPDYASVACRGNAQSYSSACSRFGVSETPTVTEEPLTVTVTQTNTATVTTTPPTPPPELLPRKLYASPLVPLPDTDPAAGLRRFDWYDRSFNDVVRHSDPLEPPGTFADGRTAEDADFFVEPGTGHLYGVAADGLTLYAKCEVTPESVMSGSVLTWVPASSIESFESGFYFDCERDSATGLLSCACESGVDLVIRILQFDNPNVDRFTYFKKIETLFGDEVNVYIG